ncbi:MAG TPA: pilin [Candidatus Nitrosocosmicus sp.]|nr:pilin [Candidatus Nitrosocosmicus sp.]
MKKIGLYVILILLSFLLFTPSVFAASTGNDINQFTQDTLNIITLIATGAAVFFLVKGGYLYLISTGKPDAIIQAKKTIKNALIGLVIVLGASLIVSVFKSALNTSTSGGTLPAIPITPIESVHPSGGLTQVLIDAIAGFIQNIVESATTPIVNGIIGYLTTTPNLLENQVVFRFWLVILGITDSLFVVIVALLGLRFMSASSFGYDDEDISHLLPKIGLAFLGANISLFLANYAILSANAMVHAVLNSTGGLNHAWIVNAINPTSFITNTTPLITLFFLVLFLIVSIVLLFLYISRLIMISLGAVLSPLIFLLWIVPKFSDFAEISVKSYIVSVFIVFVHVVIIQLASSFLAIPEHTGNSLVSIAVAIGLFFVLLKTPSLMMQMVMYTSSNGAFRKLGSQIINVISTDNSSSATRDTVKRAVNGVKTPRKVVAA